MKRNEKTSKRRVSIDEKIDELIEWYKKYPKIKLIGRVKYHATYYYENEAKEYGIDDIDLKEYHERMEKYLEYVIARKRAGELTDEQINKCKEGNLGLIFGYSDEVKKFSKEYQKKEEIALDIIRICGSVENYINSYKTGTLKKQGLIYRDGFIPVLNNKNKIDMDSNPNANNYFILIQSIGRSMNFEPYYDECLYSQYNNIIVFSSKEIDEALRILNPREEEIIRARFGLDDGKSKSLVQTGESLGLSRERIRQIEAKALRKIQETQRDVFEEIMPVALGKIGELMEEEGYLQYERLPEGLNFLEYNEMITDAEKRMLSKIVDDIWNSKMLFRKNEDEQSYDFDIKRLEIIKEIKASIKKREKQKRLTEEQKLLTEEKQEILKERILETTIEATDKETDINGLLDKGKKMESLNVPIGRLGLKPKEWKALTEKGVRTVQDIINLDERDLLDAELGNKSGDEIREKIKVYREATIEGTARVKILEGVRKLLPARARTILARENYRNDNNNCGILQLIEMEESELIGFLQCINGFGASSVEKTIKIFNEYKNSKEYKDIIEMLNDGKETVQGETIEDNNIAIKKVLVERILVQQETIAEQQTEINRLNRQNKEL